MKQWNRLAMAVCLAAATAACAGDQEPEVAETQPPAVGTAGADAGVDPANPAVDRDFLADVMADNRAEIELGKLAQQKASNKQVKDFAAMIVKDHTKAGEDLKQALAQANIEPATINPDMEHGRELRERLSKLSGAKFDREYIDAMIEEHQNAIDLVKDKAEGPANTPVQGWASKTLPVLQKHLERARQIDQTLEKTSKT